MKNVLSFLVAAMIVVTIVSCSSNREVIRVSTDQVIDLSGRWNDVDSKLTAEAMIEQVLGDKWLDEFSRANKSERPVVIVGFVKNKSHEHIVSETFIKDLEKSFLKSGRVRLVQASDKREEIRVERADQQNHSSPQTMKNWGKEIGADFMLQGTINSIVDSYKKNKVVFYQIDLELTNIETNEIVWIGDKKIKKVISN